MIQRQFLWISRAHSAKCTISLSKPWIDVMLHWKWQRPFWPVKLYKNDNVVWKQRSNRRNPSNSMVMNEFVFYLAAIISNEFPETSRQSLKDEKAYLCLLCSYDRKNKGTSLLLYIIPDVLGGINDLFDARHPQSDVHGCYTSKMESFQGHLSTGLPDALCTQGPHCWAWLHLSSVRENTWFHQTDN